ncbi:MAG: phosphate ABC transporter substrate-binding protein [Pseudolabrys sp.]
MADKVKLFTLLGDHPGVMPLKTGEIASDLVEFAFDDVKVPNTAFKALVRDGKYDCAELAIVTFLQAKSFDKPYALLPATVMGRGQLHTLFMNADKPLMPEQLAGKSVGVRSYTVTTGVWVRGILSDLYGIDPNGMTWVSFEDPHVAEFVDPHNVIHAPPNRTLEDMLAAGEIDAAVLGKTDQKPPLVPMFKDAAKVDRDWAAKNGGVPINHMMVLRSQIMHDRPDVAREVYRMLAESKAKAFPKAPSPDPIRFGIEDNRVSLEKMIGFCVQQKLIPRAITVDALFAEAKAAGL